MSQICLAQKTPLKITSWNILFGGCRFEQSNQSSVSTQLLKLISSKPDILVLIEYIPQEDCLSLETKNLLKASFPEQIYIPYNPQVEAGIKIYCNDKITCQLDYSEPLPWYSLKFTPKERDEYYAKWKDSTSIKRWERRFVSIHVKKESKAYQLFPIHFTQPWNDYGRLFRENPISFWPSLESKARLLSKITFSHSTPLYYQAENFLQKLKKYYSLENDPLILIGDFNIPSNFPNSHINLFTSVLNYYDKIPNLKKSFPTHSVSTDHPSYHLLIDQVFTSSSVEVKEKEILNFIEGSDHYPVSIQVQ